MNRRTVEVPIGDVKAKSSSMSTAPGVTLARFGRLQLEITDREVALPGDGSSTAEDRPHGAQPTPEPREATAKRADLLSFRTFETLATPNDSLVSVSAGPSQADVKASAASTIQIREMVKYLRGTDCGPLSPIDAAQAAAEGGYRPLPVRPTELADAIFMQCKQRLVRHVDDRSIRTIAKAWCDVTRDEAPEVRARALASLVKHARALSPGSSLSGLRAGLEEVLPREAEPDRGVLRKLISTLVKSCAFVPDPLIREVGATFQSVRGHQAWPEPCVADVHKQLTLLGVASAHVVLICRALGMPVPVDKQLKIGTGAAGLLPKDSQATSSPSKAGQDHPHGHCPIHGAGSPDVEAMRREILRVRGTQLSALSAEDMALYKEHKGQGVSNFPQRPMELTDIFMTGGDDLGEAEACEITQFWCAEGKATSLDVVDRAVRPLVKNRAYVQSAITDTALSAVFDALGGTAMSTDHLLKITSILSRACEFVLDHWVADSGAALVASRVKPWPKASVAAVHAQFSQVGLPSYYGTLICKSLGMPPPAAS